MPKQRTKEEMREYQRQRRLGLKNAGITKNSENVTKKDVQDAPESKNSVTPDRNTPANVTPITRSEPIKTPQGFSAESVTDELVPGNKNVFERQGGTRYIIDAGGRKVELSNLTYKPSQVEHYSQPDCECGHCKTARANKSNLVINHGVFKPAEQLKDGEINRVSLPGDADYVSPYGGISCGTISDVVLPVDPQIKDNNDYGWQDILNLPGAVIDECYRQAKAVGDSILLRLRRAAGYQARVNNGAKLRCGGYL
jgi:hypothetical protein